VVRAHRGGRRPAHPRCVLCHCCPGNVHLRSRGHFPNRVQHAKVSSISPIRPREKRCATLFAKERPDSKRSPQSKLSGRQPCNEAAQRRSKPWHPRQPESVRRWSAYSSKNLPHPRIWRRLQPDRRSRYNICRRRGCPSRSRGWSKSSLGSCVIPSSSITRRDPVFAGAVKDTNSSRPNVSNPWPTIAPAPSVARLVPNTLLPVSIRLQRAA
jgi:hypothetical protein